MNETIKSLESGDIVKVNGHKYRVTDRVTAQMVSLASLDGGRAAAYGLRTSSAWRSKATLEITGKPRPNLRSASQHKTILSLEVLKRK